MNCLKNDRINKKLSQEIYDNIFLNIENNLREMGHGDVTVNKKMKHLNKIFHDLLLNFINENKADKIQINEMLKYLFIMEKNDVIPVKLEEYFKKYHNFCFDIINKNMIKDLDKFEY